MAESLGVELLRNPEHAEKLTPQYASLLLFHSFRHSQGVEEIQRDIFSYIHIIRPEWRITPEDKPGIFAGSKEMIHAFLYGSGHGRKQGMALHDSYPIQDIETVNIAIADALDHMEDRFDDKKSKPKKKRELIQIMSDSIINTDLHWLLEEDGRERSPVSEKPKMDPWLSFIVHFGLNGNSTGVPELDEMYRDIRAFIVGSNVQINQELTEILKIYKRKHPGVKINLNP